MKGAIEISKLFGFILMVFVVVLAIIISIWGFSSIRDMVFDLIDTFINFLGFE